MARRREPPKLPGLYVHDTSGASEATPNSAPRLSEPEDRRSTEYIQRREQEGLCLSCGNQLYQIKQIKKGLFRKKDKEVKVALSVPGQVERGQCLECSAATSAQNISVAHRPTTSLDSSDRDVGYAQAKVAETLVVSSDNSSIATYVGSLNVYGERDGKGTMTWENGDVYTGDFFNGNRHGSGTLTFADGSEYVGEWECNKQHGIGTRRWSNGDCYSGQYSSGERTGEGRFYFSNGDLYIGEWVNGVMEGSGRYYYASGQRFEGTFRAGSRRGKGKLQRKDGSLDVGTYINDVRVGVGVRWSVDRTLAWKMQNGKVRKKIPIAEAVSLDYDIDAAVMALDETSAQVI